MLCRDSADKAEVKQTARDHPEEDLLELYALQRLTSEQDQALEEHVYQCGRCQQQVIRFVREARLIRAAFVLSQQAVSGAYLP